MSQKKFHFNSSAYSDFLSRWGIHSRKSSAHYPQSNGRAEAAVKSAKRILLGSIDTVTGKLNTEKAARSLLIYRNTPTQDAGSSPAIMCFGRPMRDHLPNQKRSLREEWQQIASSREQAHARRHIVKEQKTRPPLEQLETGQVVQVQNQYGVRPGKWYNTGTVAEVLPYRQYRVVMDGSRRVTTRNRRFLRPINPVAKHIMAPSQEFLHEAHHPDEDLSQPVINTENCTLDLPTIQVEKNQVPLTGEELQPIPELRSPQPLGTTSIRRSSRISKPPKQLVMSLSNDKSYTYTE